MDDTGSALRCQSLSLLSMVKANKTADTSKQLAFIVYIIKGGLPFGVLSIVYINTIIFGHHA